MSDETLGGSVPTCKDIFLQASSFHDGELTEVERQAFSRHLEACPHCLDFYRGFQVTIDRAREAVLEPPPSDLVETVVRGLRDKLTRSA